MSVKRQCAVCKQQIDLLADKGNYIYDKAVFKHIQCFKKEKTSLKRNVWDEKMCDEYIKSHEAATFARASPFIAKAQEKLDEEMSDGIKHQLTTWLLSAYNAFLPKYFYTKLESIYDGTYKGLPQAIPPADLYDMWTQKKEYLDKVNQKNHDRGKDISGLSRVNYDLAILLNKYDGYLKWKQNKQNIEKELTEKTNKNPDVDYAKLSDNKVKNTKRNTGFDVSEVIDMI